MKKHRLVLALLTLLSAPAHAEHKLLITDVLDKGQSEISASVSYSHAQNDFSDRWGVGAPGSVKSIATSSTLSAAIGLGPGIQLSASIPYLFSQETTYTRKDIPPVSSVIEREGLGDLMIGAKGLIVSESRAPVTLVAGLNLKLDMQGSNHGGTGTTNISPYIALSRKIASETRLYASYAAVVRNHGAADSHTLLAGVEQIVSRRVTAVAEGGMTFWNNSERISSTKEFGGALAAYLQLHGNLYLVPSVQASLVNGYDWKNSRTHYGDTRVFGGTMQLYYLF